MASAELPLKGFGDKIWPSRLAEFYRRMHRAFAIESATISHRSLTIFPRTVRFQGTGAVPPRSAWLGGTPATAGHKRVNELVWTFPRKIELELRVPRVVRMLGLGRGYLPQRRVQADAVTKRLDVLEDARRRLAPGCVVFVVKQFFLERAIIHLHSATAWSGGAEPSRFASVVSPAGDVRRPWDSILNARYRRSRANSTSFAHSTCCPFSPRSCRACSQPDYRQRCVTIGLTLRPLANSGIEHASPACPNFASKRVEPIGSPASRVKTNPPRPASLTRGRPSAGRVRRCPLRLLRGGVVLEVLGERPAGVLFGGVGVAAAPCVRVRRRVVRWP